jgi:flagellar hook-length control protein FliK
MTLSAIDNPLALVGADSKDTDKSAKNSAFIGNSDVFALLLQTTGVQQVAYAGTNDEFAQTLDMQDETVGHEARMGEDHQKYDGLGLNGADAAVIESTRSTTKIDAPKESIKPKLSTNKIEVPDAPKDSIEPTLSTNKIDAPDVPKDSIEPTLSTNKVDAPDAPKDSEVGKQTRDDSDLSTGVQVKGDGSDTSKAAITDTAKLLALGVPSQESAVDITRAANAAAAQRAADAQATRQSGVNAQNALVSARPKQQDAVTAEELPKSRYITGKPETGNTISNASQPKNGIKATKVQEDVVSQPTSSLAASATLAAQIDKSARAAVEAPIDLADDLGGETRVPLPNGNAGRGNIRPQQNTPQSQSTPQNANAGLTSPPQANPAPPTVPNAASQQAQLATAGAVRPDAGVQPNQPFTDPLAGSSSNSNAGQNTQRGQQAQTPRPARPPVLPQEVTNQVAVQIKKAIGQGADQIRIQLKPAELGVVEVKLSVTEDGRAMAVVSAERPETLDLLQRDASGLRQALQDAGLSTDSNSLSFNLRGEGGKFGQEMAERGHAPQNNGDETANAGNGEEADAAEAASIAAQIAAADGRVNVQI